MGESKITKCLHCGGDEFINVDEQTVMCKYCRTKFKKEPDEFYIELIDATTRRQVLREFSQAEQICTALLNKHPESSEIYWQALLARYGVVYVIENGEAKPTFFSFNYDGKSSILNHEYYTKALKYAKNDENKKFYLARAEQLDILLKDFFALIDKEEESYDIFISFKQTEEAVVGDKMRRIETDDCIKAKEIYNYLKGKYKVFFSPVSIGKDIGIVGKKYEPRILKALQTSQAMILLGSQKEYLNAHWVENEWKRYIYFIQKGHKLPQSLILGYTRVMPELPAALDDGGIQRPNFDMFNAGYLQELEKKLSFVKSSKGFKPKTESDTVIEDFGYGDTDGFGIGIAAGGVLGNGSGRGYVITPTVQKLMRSAEDTLHNGMFTDAKNFYDMVISQAPDLAEAYVGRFCTNIKATGTDVIPEKAVNINVKILEDITKAFKCSADEKYCRGILDKLIYGIKNCDWKKAKILINFVSGYLDEAVARNILLSLETQYNAKISSNDISSAEGIFASARKLFYAKNLDFNIQYMTRYAVALYNHKSYKEALKYFEELAGARKSSEYYLYVLKCRVGTQDVTVTKFNLSGTIRNDASKKKPYELNNDEIFQRYIICAYQDGEGGIYDTVTSIVKHQIKTNGKKAHPFIQIFADCLVSLKREKDKTTFLFDVAESYLSNRNFKQARKYYEEILEINSQSAAAHFGTLKCRLKAVEDYDLIPKGKTLMKYQEFQNACNCSEGNEYDYYMSIYFGKLEKVKANNKTNFKPQNNDENIDFEKCLGWMGKAYAVWGHLSLYSLGLYSTAGIVVALVVPWLVMAFLVCQVAAIPLIPIISIIVYLFKRILYIRNIKSEEEYLKRIVNYKSHTLSNLISYLIILYFIYKLKENPEFILSKIHYGWLIAILIFISILWIIKTAWRVYLIKFNKITNSNIVTREIRNLIISFFVVVITLIALIHTLSHMPVKTYSLKSASDFNLLKNLPNAEYCSYVLENDIDFNKKGIPGFGEIENFYGTFDGNYHSLKNIRQEKRYKQYKPSSLSKDNYKFNAFGLFTVNLGEIKNLSIEDSNFYADGSKSFLEHLPLNDDSVKKYKVAGILAAENMGNINNCRVYDTYLNFFSKYDSDTATMGIAGNNTGHINNMELFFSSGGDYTYVSIKYGTPNIKNWCVGNYGIGLSYYDKKDFFYNNYLAKYDDEIFKIGIPAEFKQAGWHYGKNGYPTPCTGFDD